MKQLTSLIIVFLFLSCDKKEQQVSRSFIKQASGYSQAVMTTYNGLKTIHISGQIGEGEDLATQMKGALLNIESILKEQGASFKDIVKMNHYVVNYKPEDLEAFRNTRKEIMGDANMPASTLVGVTSLFSDKYLIEIDAIAIVKE